MSLEMTNLKFNPPEEKAKKLPRYASYSAGIMKTHSRIGDAKNSLNNRMWTWQDTEEVIGSNWEGKPRYKRIRVTRYAAILENIDGTWYTLYNIPEGTSKDNLPWMKEFYQDTWGWNWNRVTEYFLNSPYHQSRREEGKYNFEKRPAPMTVDEYVKWRLAVAREQWEEAGRVLEL